MSIFCMSSFYVYNYIDPFCTIRYHVHGLVKNSNTLFEMQVLAIFVTEKNTWIAFKVQLFLISQRQQNVVLKIMKHYFSKDENWTQFLLCFRFIFT